MLIQKAFKFRLEPNTTQCQVLSQIVGNCRFIWNKALSLQNESLEKTGKIMKYKEVSANLKIWRREEDTTFLSNTSFDSQQQKLRDLDRAFWDHFKKDLNRGLPRFKKKGRDDTFRCVGDKQYSLKDNKVRIPLAGWMKFRKSMDIVGKPKNITVSRKAGRWYISIQTEYEVEARVHPCENIIALDQGVAKFAALSDRTFIEPLNSFRKHEIKLAKEQRKLSRKVKFSNNWKIQKTKISRIHEEIANVRRDFLQKESTRITNENQVVIMEDLKVRNMSASAKGTIDNPGKNVRAKSGLNKSILDQGWFEFRRQIGYKLEWKGGRLILVPPHHTSQTCPVCGHISAENRRSQSVFECVQCLHNDNADLVAAANLLAVGQTVLAFGDITRIAG